MVSCKLGDEFKNCDVGCLAEVGEECGESYRSNSKECFFIDEATKLIPKPGSRPELTEEE